MRRIKNTNQMNIVLDCSAEILFDVLLHAQQVGLMGTDYSYIITSLVSLCLFTWTFLWNLKNYPLISLEGIVIFCSSNV